jgi:hypothetical protein
MSRPKEPHFFDVEFDRGLEHYWQSAFAHWQGEAHAGESTPSYLWYPEAAARIAASLPNVRIILLVRDPTERAFSSWLLHRNLGREERSFAAAVGVRSDGTVARACPDPATIAGLHAERVRLRRYDPAYQSFLYLEPGRYAPHLRCYWEACGRERVKVVLFDDLRRDPSGVVREILGFLGADAAVPIANLGRRNARLDPLDALLRRTPWGRVVRQVVPRRVRALAGRALGPLWTPEAPDPAARTAVQGYYRPYNRELARMLERDLASWG